MFEGHVYWTTKDKGEVWRTNKFGKGNKVKVLTINPWLTQVRIYQEHRHNQTGQNIWIRKTNTNHIKDFSPGTQDLFERLAENNDTEALTSRGECSLLMQQCFGFTKRGQALQFQNSMQRAVARECRV